MAPSVLGVLVAAVLALQLCVARATTNTVRPLAFELDTDTGSMTISYDGHPWLAGGLYAVGKLTSREGTLVLTGLRESTGRDPLGVYSATTMDWSRRHDGIVMQASVRLYPDDPGMIVFEQFFPAEVDLRSLGAADLGPASPGTLFPGFDQAGEGAELGLPCFAYHGTFAVPQGCTVRSYQASEEGGAPLVIYNASKEDLPMIVLSPLNHPVASQLGTRGSAFGAGIKSSVETIPAEWSQLFIISSGRGINRGMLAWGDRMLKFHGRPRIDNRYRDAVHGGIGYWTDSGAYYHGTLGDDPTLGHTFEAVLPKVQKYHDSIGVTFRHWEFDSWFYPKDGPVMAVSGFGGAVTEWTAKPDIFPHGLARMHSILQVPMVMHNRHWSPKSEYIKRWRDIPWYTSSIAAMPKDPHKFFMRFFKQQVGWGLSMYKQDWMTMQYKYVHELQTNISLGDQWLAGMAAGAEHSGRTIQYCMPHPNFILAAAAFPAVTNARASGDYFAAKDQWNIGTTALLHWALGILPFKDVFYSSNLRQEGGQTVGPETHPNREAIIAVLSASLVAVGDGIHLMNATRVLATCRKDGVVLKPDRPLTTVDACFRAQKPTCPVFSTYSDVEGLGRVHYYFNNDGSSAMHSHEVHLSGSDSYAVYNWYTGDVFDLQDRNWPKPGYEGHIYALVTPVVRGWAFLGEVHKFVPTSTLRFVWVTVTDTTLTTSVRGVAGESLCICTARAPRFRVTCQVLAFAADGVLLATFSAWPQDSDLPWGCPSQDRGEALVEGALSLFT